MSLALVDPMKTSEILSPFITQKSIINAPLKLENLSA